jgi:hypothetical protein
MARSARCPRAGLLPVKAPAGASISAADRPRSVEDISHLFPGRGTAPAAPTGRRLVEYYENAP